MDFKVIDCVDHIYIKNVERYGGTYLDSYLFDGITPEKTNKEYWYKLKTIPKVITKKKPKQQINKRYELKSGYAATDIMPKIITMDMYNTDEYDEIIGCYSLKYDEVDGGYEEIDFTISNIYSRENFTFVPNTYNANVDLLTQIEYPEEAHQDMPCQLDSAQVFDLIRKHVKQNINTSIAKITSDYDFHFEVQRNIQLAEPYSIMVDTNNSWANKRRKPKWVNRMISDKQVTILNIKNKPGGNDYGKDCSLPPSITGKNYEDLTEKVNNYLSELMKTINKKYCECPKCKSWGVVEVK